MLQTTLLVGFAFLMAAFTLDGPDDYRYTLLATGMLFVVFLFLVMVAELIGWLFPARRK